MPPPGPLGLSDLVSRASSILMSAAEYRARAEKLIQWSYMTTDPALVREIEAVAAEWHQLADLADQQDAMRASLKATRE